MKKVKTESGSIYEIDEENKQVRRLTGTANPTLRQGADGEWRKYANLIYNLDNSMLIVWKYDIVDEKTIARSTITSPIVATIEEAK
jgi:hypothetical protein